MRRGWGRWQREGTGLIQWLHLFKPIKSHFKRIYRRRYSRSLMYIGAFYQKRWGQGDKEEGMMVRAKWLVGPQLTWDATAVDMWCNRNFLKMVSFHGFVWLSSRGRPGPALRLRILTHKPCQINILMSNSCWKSGFSMSLITNVR